MLIRTKLLIAGLAAAVMMLTFVAVAPAGRFRVGEPEYEIKLPLRFEAAGNNITCRVTQLGRFTERTFAKSQVPRVARIRHTVRGAEAEACTGGTMTVLNETLPWEVGYVSFRGTLPRPSAIRVSMIGVAFRVSNGSITCLAGTTASKPAFGEFLINSESGANMGIVEGFRYDETVGIPLGGGFLCELAGEGHLSGTATVTDLPGLNALRVTLI